jgi:hypothetical protein
MTVASPLEALLGRRLDVLVQRDLFVRVDRAEVRPAAVERGPDLLLGQRGAALRALAFDHGVYAFTLFEIQVRPHFR